MRLCGRVGASFAAFSFPQIPICEGIQSISVFVPLCVSFSCSSGMLSIVSFMEYMLLIAVLESEVIIAFRYFSSWIALFIGHKFCGVYMEVSLDSLTFMVDFRI